MVTKDELMTGLRLYTDKLKDELGGVRVGTKSSTVEGAMWYTIDDDLYWSLYMCMNGSRIEKTPSQSNSLFYDGTPKAPAWRNYAANQFIMLEA